MPSLFEHFAILKPDLLVEQRAVTPEFYETLDRDYDQFRGHVLIAAHSFDSDWSTWEKHPAGDELVVLLSGAAELVLSEAGGERCIALSTPGEFACVPKDTWHTARVSTPTQMLFLTPGEGTENAANPGI